MGRVIGFLDFPRVWDGPAIIEFTLFSKHSETTRYKARLGNRDFDLYAPHFLLPCGVASPTRILVALGRAKAPVHNIGFRDEAQPPSHTSEVCVFEFVDSKANSKRYMFMHEGKKYSLYVPNEVFAQESHPPKIYLMIGAPQAITNVVHIDHDVAEVFHDSESVNRVLRMVIGLAKQVPQLSPEDDSSRKRSNREIPPLQPGGPT